MKIMYIRLEYLISYKSERIDGINNRNLKLYFFSRNIIIISLSIAKNNLISN